LDERFELVRRSADEIDVEPSEPLANRRVRDDLFTSALSRDTTVPGVPAGANSPCQEAKA
jgi:hypothetical protein